MKKLASPELVVRNGKPVAVILRIEDYQEMVERLEDIEDVEALREMRRKPLQFRRLEEFLDEHSPAVGFQKS